MPEQLFYPPERNSGLQLWLRIPILEYGQIRGGDMADYGGVQFTMEAASRTAIPGERGIRVDHTMEKVVGLLFGWTTWGREVDG